MPTKVGYIGDSASSGGMDWNSKVWISDTSLGNGHQYCHTQLITDQHWLKRGSDAPVFDPITHGVTDLDGADFNYGDIKAVGTNSGMLALFDNDSPGFSRLQQAVSGYSEVYFLTGAGVNTIMSESFTDYLMFKSANHSGCWVPLRKFTWSWKMKATYDNSTWTLSDTDAPNPSASQETQMPPIW
ncbi:MAG: hypothetical protein EOO88_55725 [Pedobacter sp.]|nr:MAG: hypothetical protein EOO88_55725 [Pedobacter sp.]